MWWLYQFFLHGAVAEPDTGTFTIMASAMGIWAAVPSQQTLWVAAPSAQGSWVAVPSQGAVEP